MTNKNIKALVITLVLLGLQAGTIFGMSKKRRRQRKREQAALKKFKKSLKSKLAAMTKKTSSAVRAVEAQDSFTTGKKRVIYDPLLKDIMSLRIDDIKKCFGNAAGKIEQDVWSTIKGVGRNVDYIKSKIFKLTLAKKEKYEGLQESLKEKNRALEEAVRALRHKQEGCKSPKRVVPSLKVSRLRSEIEKFKDSSRYDALSVEIEELERFEVELDKAVRHCEHITDSLIRQHG